MKSLDFLNEGIGEDAHEMHLDHEVQMARQELYHAAEDAIALHKLLRHVSEQQGLEGWVSSKITLAADYLKTIREHLEYQMMSGGPAEGMTTMVGDAMPVAEGSIGQEQLKQDRAAKAEWIKNNPLMKDKSPVQQQAAWAIYSTFHKTGNDKKKEQGVAEGSESQRYRVILTLTDDSAGPGETATRRVAVVAIGSNETEAIEHAKRALQNSNKYDGSRIVGARATPTMANEGSEDIPLNQQPASLDKPYVPRDYQTKEPLTRGADGNYYNSKGQQRDSLHGGPISAQGYATHRGLGGKPPQKPAVKVDEMSSGSVATVVNPPAKNKSKVGSLFGGTYKQPKKAK